MLVALKYYDLPEGSLEERDYLVFPVELEHDPLVFFHVTPSINLPSIEADGLQPGDKVGASLSSISYAEDSKGAMIWWHYRAMADDEWVVLALRFPNRDELRKIDGTWHSNALEVQPDIVGVIVIPPGYRLS